MGVIGDENPFLFAFIICFQLFKDYFKTFLVFFIGFAERVQDEPVRPVMFPAGVQESLDPPIAGGGLGYLLVEMKQDITVVFAQQTGGLDASHVIVRIDTAGKQVFPLNGDNGDVVGGQLF